MATVLAQMSNHRTSTPRPSISPLSSASKTQRSPILARDANGPDSSPSRRMLPGSRSHIRPDLEELQDDHSSSLSDPDDDHEEEEDELRFDEAATRHYAGATTLDRTQDVDSEAETERLEHTPQKLRHRELGKTPTKLRDVIVNDHDPSEPASPSPSEVRPTVLGSPAGSFQSGPSHLHPMTILKITDTVCAGHKRKRSESVESPLSSAASELDESPRKRFQESPDELLGGSPVNLPVTNGFAEAEEPHDDIDIDDLEGDEADTTLLEAVNRKKGKTKPRRTDRRDAAHVATSIEDTVDVEGDTELAIGLDTEEGRLRRNHALLQFEDLAKQFTSFKEKIYAERLDSLTAELNMLAQAECDHPEYVRQVSTIDARMEKQIRETRALYHYRTQCIKQRTLAERSQMHSQYFQDVREIRERLMDKLGADLYNIQTERRESHQEKDAAYVYRFPTDRAVQIRLQAKYNQEVSVLSGIAKYVGWPAAPDIDGATGDQLEADLKAMKIPRRVTSNISQPRPVIFNRNASSAIAQSERIAHEQYLEQNAWARPQAPTQQHGTPNLTHTPDWADLPGQSRAGSRLTSLAQTAHEPFTTPLAIKSSLLEPSSVDTVPMNSAGAVSHSQGPITAPSNRRDDIDRLGSTELGSPVLVAKQRQTAGDVGSFRNFSNMSRVSGASTIDAQSDAEKERDSGQGQHSSLSAFGTEGLNNSSRESMAAPGFRLHDDRVGVSASMRPD